MSFIRFSTELKKAGYTIKLNSLFRDPSVSSIPQLLEQLGLSPETSDSAASGPSHLAIPDPEPFELMGVKTDEQRKTLRRFIASQLSKLDTNKSIKPEDVEEATPLVPGQEQMRWKVQSCDTLPLWWLSDSYRLGADVDVGRWKEAWNQTFDAEPVSAFSHFYCPSFSYKRCTDGSDFFTPVNFSLSPPTLFVRRCKVSTHDILLSSRQRSQEMGSRPAQRKSGSTNLG